MGKFDNNMKLRFVCENLFNPTKFHTKHECNFKLFTALMNIKVKRPSFPKPFEKNLYNAAL